MSAFGLKKQDSDFGLGVGRRTMLMSRRKGLVANHIVRINGKRIDLKALEQVMMLHFPLKECAFIPKKNEEG
ncbi:hypothetical protein ACEQPO_02520 [Bacillus sp. SL00103]